MREWQPDRADLLPPGRQIIEDTPGDDQMRLRVVMAENKALSEEDDPRRAGDEGGGRGKLRRKGGEARGIARYNHVSAAQNNANRCSRSSNGSTGSPSRSAVPAFSLSPSSTPRSFHSRRSTTCSSC